VDDVDRVPDEVVVVVVLRTGVVLPEIVVSVVGEMTVVVSVVVSVVVAASVCCARAGDIDGSVVTV